MSARHRFNPRRHAFTLLEMLFVILMAAMIVTACGRLVYQIGRVFREVPDATAAITTSQQWLEHIRRDAWSASAIASIDERTLSVTTDNQTVNWQINDTWLTREEAGLVTRWKLTHPLAFRKEGNLWTLQSADGSAALAQAKGGAK